MRKSSDFVARFDNVIKARAVDDYWKSLMEHYKSLKTDDEKNKFLGWVLPDIKGLEKKRD